MSPYVGLVFDIIILVALAATMWRAVTLSRQFDRMQADRKAFEQLIGALNVAASRAEAVIKSIKDNAIESGGVLQDKVTRARGISDELEIMIQAGDNLAERLQGLAEKSRINTTNNAQGAAPVQTPELRASAPQGAQPRTKAEKELLEAMKAKQQS